MNGSKFYMRLGYIKFSEKQKGYPVKNVSIEKTPHHRSFEAQFFVVHQYMELWKQ